MGRLKVLCAGYREWAIEAFAMLTTAPDLDPVLVNAPGDLSQTFIDLEPDLALFYGWSWRVPAELVNASRCLCLHPSRLPAYRGGSPLQHQIIAGLKSTSLCLFRMTPELDAGPIIEEWPLSLEGSLEDIFRAITIQGGAMALSVARGLVEGREPAEYPQEGKPSYCPRRTPAMSEITIRAMRRCSAVFLANKVRALSHPDYPPAFVRTVDGKRLNLLDVEVAND